MTDDLTTRLCLDVALDQLLNPEHQNLHRDRAAVRQQLDQLDNDHVWVCAAGVFASGCGGGCRGGGGGGGGVLTWGFGQLCCGCFVGADWFVTARELVTNVV